MCPACLLSLFLCLCVDTRTCPVQFGCLVVNAPTANTVAAAEHGISLMTALARNVSQADASMKAGKWERTKYVGVSLVDKTLAIMGFGKVWMGWVGWGMRVCKGSCSRGLRWGRGATATAGEGGMMWWMLPLPWKVKLCLHHCSQCVNLWVVSF